MKTSDRVQITRHKVGAWHQRTRYTVSVDGVVVGTYTTHAEAVRVGMEHVKYLEQEWEALRAHMEASEGE